MPHGAARPQLEPCCPPTRQVRRPAPPGLFSVVPARTGQRSRSKSRWKRPADARLRGPGRANVGGDETITPSGCTHRNRYVNLLIAGNEGCDGVPTGAIERDAAMDALISQRIVADVLAMPGSRRARREFHPTRGASAHAPGCASQAGVRRTPEITDSPIRNVLWSVNFAVWQDRRPCYVIEYAHSTC